MNTFGKSLEIFLPFFASPSASLTCSLLIQLAGVRVAIILLRGRSFRFLKKNKNAEGKESADARNSSLIFGHAF